MAKTKNKRTRKIKNEQKANQKIQDINNSSITTPRTAKLVLLGFGIGPLLLMGVFLFANGFFNSP